MPAYDIYALYLYMYMYIYVSMHVPTPFPQVPVAGAGRSQRRSGRPGPRCSPGPGLVCAEAQGLRDGFSGGRMAASFFSGASKLA